jgi:PhoH-like ATPase
MFHMKQLTKILKGSHPLSTILLNNLKGATYNMTKLFVADTNVLLTSIELLTDYNIVLLSHTLRELDHHKSSHNGELAYNARKAVRYIKSNKDKFTFDVRDYDGSILGSQFDNKYQDNNILASCVANNNQYGIITNDVLLQYKAEGFGIEVIDLGNEKVEDTSKYSGIKDLYIDNVIEDQELLASIYENPESNQFDMVEHEYLVVWDKTKPTYHRVTGEINGYEAIDTFRFDGEKLVKLKYKPTEDLFMGKTKPLNVKQQVAFDMLQNKNIGVNLILGNAGAGKDYIMVAHLLQLLQRDEIDKIVFIRNIAPVKDAGETGFLKGDLLDKMINWAAPLIDAVGGEDGFRMLYEKGKIEIQHFESIRGRSFTNCGIYCTEIQNMSGDHARMILSRVGKHSILYMNGDINQIDKEVFKANSAINTLKKLKGNKLFGLVTLDKTERSDIASLSELI